jgi:hypothetical protein
MAHFPFQPRWIYQLAELQRLEKAKRLAEKRAAREAAMKAAAARNSDAATKDTPHE